VGFFVAAGLFGKLLLEPAALFFRIVQLAEGVSNLQAPLKISKRSTHAGSSGLFFDNGEISTGKS